MKYVCKCIPLMAKLETRLSWSFDTSMCSVFILRQSHHCSSSQQMSTVFIENLCMCRIPWRLSPYMRALTASSPALRAMVRCQVNSLVSSSSPCSLPIGSSSIHQPLFPALFPSFIECLQPPTHDLHIARLKHYNSSSHIDIP